MKILDKEIEFDLNDAESIDKLQELDNSYAEKLKESTKLTAQCQVYKEFFDKAIGEGTSDILFEGKNDYMQIVRAYNEFIDRIEEKVTEFMEEAQKAQKRYERYVK